MKRLLWILLPLVMMTACIETTPEDLNGSDNGSDSNEWPFEDDEDKEDDEDEQEDVMPYIYGMKFIDGDGYVFYWEFDYDEEGHLIYCNWCDELIVNFSWKDDNTIELSGSINGSIQCDANGKPVQHTIIDEETTIFEYGRNGYVSEVEYDGDIYSCSTRSGNYLTVPSGDGGEMLCEYSSYLNNSAIDIHDCLTYFCDTSLLFFYGLKFPGTYSRNLLSGYEFGAEGWDGSESYKFDYIFDEAGNIDYIDILMSDDGTEISAVIYFDYGQGYSDEMMMREIMMKRIRL